MRSRLYELVPPPYDELAVHTFGSYCAALLRTEAAEAGLAPGFVPVVPRRTGGAAARGAGAADPAPRRDPRQPAPLLAGFVSRIDLLKQRWSRRSS